MSDMEEYWKSRFLEAQGLIGVLQRTIDGFLKQDTNVTMLNEQLTKNELAELRDNAKYFRWINKHLITFLDETNPYSDDSLITQISSMMEKYGED